VAIRVYWGGTSTHQEDSQRELALFVTACTIDMWDECIVIRVGNGTLESRTVIVDDMEREWLCASGKVPGCTQQVEWCMCDRQGEGAGVEVSVWNECSAVCTCKMALCAGDSR
jgi:hypothetical protein